MVLTNHGHARDAVRQYPLSAMRLYFDGFVQEWTGGRATESEEHMPPVEGDFSQYEEARREAKQRTQEMLKRRGG